MPEHTPYERDVEITEDVGGVLIRLGTRRMILCGCTDELRFDYGHEQNTPGAALQRSVDATEPVPASIHTSESHNGSEGSFCEDKYEGDEHAK